MDSMITINIFFMAVLTDEARKLSAFPAQAAIFDPLNIKYIYRNHKVFDVADRTSHCGLFCIGSSLGWKKDC